MKMLYNGLPELGVDYHILVLHPLSGANEVSGWSWQLSTTAIHDGR
jgi:hypothetical protein